MRETGPGPLRTARGAGRFERALGAGLRLLVLRAVLVLFVGVLPVLRDRVLEVPRAGLFDPVEDVLLLRDPGGEDVRVAMVSTVIDGPTRHRDHRSVSAGCPHGQFFRPPVPKRFAGLLARAGRSP
ncbi:hypothetical protein GCM10027600_08770 [Nocardioides ginsengisegetis]